MPRHARRSARLAAAVVATLPLAVPVTPARAANVSWSFPTSGRWLDAANWSTTAVPSTSDSVTIDSPGSYTVTLDDRIQVRSISLNAPGATLSVSKPDFPYISFSIISLAIPAGTLAVRSSGRSQIPIDIWSSFNNAGTVTFDADAAPTSTAPSVAFQTSSASVVNSGTIEAHAAPPPPPDGNYYPAIYSFTGSAGKTFTNTGTLRTVGASSLYLNKYTVNQNAGALDGDVELYSGTLNYNGGSCSPATPVYLQDSTLNIAPSATNGNFLLGGNTSLSGNILAGNTVSTRGTAPITWTGSTTFTNAGRLVVGYYPGTVPSTTTATPSLSLGSSAYVLVNTGTLELNSPNVPATNFYGSVTNQGAVTVNPSNTTYSKVPTKISGSFTQNTGGSLAIDPSTSLALANVAHFYFNGGTVTGTVSLNNSTVHFAPGLADTGGGTFSYSSTASSPVQPFTGNIPSGATFAHRATTSGFTVPTFYFPSFSNAGTLYISLVGSGFRPVYVINDSSTKGTFTNTGTIADVTRGAYLEIDGNLTNTGHIESYYLTVYKGAFNQNAGTLDVNYQCVTTQGTFNYNGGTLTGKPVGLEASTLNIAPNTGPAAFVFYTGACTLHGSPAAGSTLALDTAISGTIGVSLTADPFTNPGTLSFTASSYSTNSTLTVTGSGALANTGTLSVTKGLGGTRTLNANVTNAGTFSVGPGATLTLTGSLTTSTPLDLQGTLDLRTGPLTWTNPAPAAADTLRTLLFANHLTNSTADARHRLAYTFSGEPTAPASLAVSLALAGDANLDGQLNADDFALIDRGLATTGSYWWQGDFDYDGQVTSADYLLIDTTYAQTHPLSPALLSQREQQFGADYVSQLLTSVPEPSSLACLFAALPLLTRRRTKS